MVSLPHSTAAREDVRTTRFTAARFAAAITASVPSTATLSTPSRPSGVASKPYSGWTAAMWKTPSTPAKALSRAAASVMSATTMGAAPSEVTCSPLLARSRTVPRTVWPLATRVLTTARRRDRAVSGRDGRACTCDAGAALTVGGDEAVRASDAVGRHDERVGCRGDGCFPGHFSLESGIQSSVGREVSKDFPSHTNQVPWEKFVTVGFLPRPGPSLENHRK